MAETGTNSDDFHFTQISSKLREIYAFALPSRILLLEVIARNDVLGAGEEFAACKYL